MNFDGVRVLVVGDVMLDHYIAGRVKRISPEAPVPVVSVAKRWSVPGGAANVARNLVRLGVDVAVAGVVGQDAAADDLRAALAAEGITDGLAASASRRTDHGSPNRVQLSQHSIWNPSSNFCSKRPYLYRMPYPSSGQPTVAAESRKQAARRPKPPFPRAASSISSSADRSAPAPRRYSFTSPVIFIARRLL